MGGLFVCFLKMRVLFLLFLLLGNGEEFGTHLVVLEGYCNLHLQLREVLGGGDHAVLGDQTRGNCMQGKHLNPYIIFPALVFFQNASCLIASLICGRLFIIDVGW